MLSPYFFSLVENSLTAITEISEETALVVNDRKVFDISDLDGDVNLKLQLNEKEVNLEELEFLLKYPKMRRVQLLELDKNEFFDDGIQLIATAPLLENLVSLSLASNKISDKGLSYLAESTTLKSLTALYLQKNQVGVKGLHSLTSSQSLSGLKLLYLKGNHFGVEGAKVLAENSQWSSLRKLYLQGCRLEDRGLSYICNSPLLEPVEELNIGFNQLTDSSVDTLIESKIELSILDIAVNHINESNIERLKTCGQFRTVLIGQ